MGVPASGEDLEAEIRSLLQKLEAIGAEADRIGKDARGEANRRREEGLREAAAILQEAREGADTERARAVSDHRDAAHRDGRRARTEASREVRRIMSAREERLTALLAEVLECVRRSGR